MIPPIDKLNKAKLKAWHREDGGSYDVLMALIEKYIDSINDEEIVGTDAFETLRMVHINQGRKKIQQFFKELDQTVSQ